MISCPWAYGSSLKLKQVSTLLGSDFGVLGHLWSRNDVIMSWLRLTSTSNCFPHPYYTYNMFEHIDMLSIGIQQQPYTVLPTLLVSDFRFWGSLVELKWCHYVMAKADSHLKLLPPSTLDIISVWAHWYAVLSMGIHEQPYTVIPTLLGSDFGILCHLWSRYDVIMSWLRLTTTSNCFPHTY